MYTDSRCAFGIVHDFGMSWKPCGLLTFNRDKINNGSYVQELFYTILFPDALAIIMTF